MSLVNGLEAANLAAARKFADRAPVRGRARTARRDGRSLRVGQFRVEGLERRLFLSSAIAAFGAQQTFATATGFTPWSVAVSDVNADGRPDLVVANEAKSGTVSVLLGNGNGTFQTQQTFAAGSSPFSVAVSDVNGDGRPDLVVANRDSRNVSVLLGNGDGTFQAQQAFETGSVPYSIAVSDVNGDGRPDLVVNNYFENTVSVLLGNGNGTFQTRQAFDTGLRPESVAVSDVNGDGRPDLVVTNWYSNTVNVLLGNGNGTFQTRQAFDTGLRPESVAVSDVNGDGRPDLVVTNWYSNTVSVLLGHGNGTFQAQQTFAAGPDPRSVAVSEVNGDGRPDIVLANSGSDTVSVLLGNGNGTFQARQTFATGSSPFSVAVSDVNGDGRPDLVVANASSTTVGVLLGDVPPVVLSINRAAPPGPNTSDSSVNYIVTFNEPVTGVDPTDFALALSGVTAAAPVVSGSGAVYTVTVNNISGNGTLGLNLVDDRSIHDSAGNPLQPGGTASFQAEQTFAAGFHPQAVVVADVNGDGKPDLLVASVYTVGVLLADGDGTFQALHDAGSARRFFPVVAVSDVNEDGRPDIVLANYGSNAVSVLLGNGDGTFQAEQTLAIFDAPISLAVADVSGDGRPDLVFADATGTVSVQLGNGDGTFQPWQTFTAGSFPTSLAVADMNGDGKPDVVSANRHSNNVSILLGNGNGTFQAQQTFATGPSPANVAVSDVNRDGRPDLVVANSSSSTVGVLLGNGNGTFQPQQTFATGAAPGSVAVSDVNGDGRPDLVVACAIRHKPRATSVLLGNGDGTFGPQQTFWTGAYPLSVAVADVNGDGRSDLVVANYSYSKTVSVLLGNSNGNFTGQVYAIVPSLDTITGTAGVDQITLTQDPDQAHIDWTLGTMMAQTLITDPNGLTINGAGSDDVISLDYTRGNPLPNTLHLNGAFTINGLQLSPGLSGTNLDIGQSTVYVNYAGGPNPAATILAAMKTGYSGGGWNGWETELTGAITSSVAAGGPSLQYGIGFADSADGVVVGQPVNTVEIRYTVMGDTNLDGVVNAVDAVQMARNYMIAGRSAWDLGNFNYDSGIDMNDALILQKNFNAKVTAAAVSAASTPVGITPVVVANGSTAAKSTLLVATNPLTSVGGGDGNGSKAVVDVTPDDKHRVKRGRLHRRDDR